MNKSGKSKTRYVLGFLFTKDHKFVYLQLKDKPEWQAGRFNGIGGKILPKENPRAAMIRNFQEQTGCMDEIGWCEVCSFYTDEFTCKVYTSFVTELPSKWHSKQEHCKGACIKVNVNPLLETVKHCDWLIPLCLDIDIFLGKVKVRQ